MMQRVLETKYDLCPACEAVWATKRIQLTHADDSEEDEDTPSPVHRDAHNRVWCVPCWQGQYGEAARRVEKDARRVEKLLRLASCESTTEHERHLAYVRAQEFHARTQNVESRLRMHVFKRKFGIVMGLCVLAMPCLLLGSRCRLAGPFWMTLGYGMLIIAVWHAWKNYSLPIGMIYRHLALAIWIAIMLGMSSIVDVALCNSIQAGEHHDTART